jgi:hypothetical protein
VNVAQVDVQASREPALLVEQSLARDSLVTDLDQ